MSDSEVLARCDCGGLSITLRGPPLLQLICHCEDCRSVTGDPTTGVVFFRKQGAEIRGEATDTELLGASGSPKYYVACRACGQFVFGDVAVLGGVYGVRPLSLGPAFSFRPACQVWTSQKSAAVTLDPDLPAFRRAPRL